jgi:hypothetical protein
MQEKAERLYQNNYLNLRDFPRPFQVTAAATDYLFFCYNTHYFIIHARTRHPSPMALA